MLAGSKNDRREFVFGISSQRLSKGLVEEFQLWQLFQR